MNDINHIVLSGRFVRDPAVRATSSGMMIGTFKVASNYYYRDKAGEWQEEPAFVSCVIFGRSAERLTQHKKSDLVFLVGRIRTECWGEEDDRQSMLTVVCYSLRFISYAKKPLTRNGNESLDTGTNGGVTTTEERPPF